jgi:hypothetical protein
MTSQKQQELIEIYKHVASHGIDREAGPRTYSIMNIRGFKVLVRPFVKEYLVKSVLDYGCGNTTWDDPSFAEDGSAKQFFGVSDVARYEPGLSIDERRVCDAVVCFDVLEHIFLADVSSVVWELFSLAEKLVIANVACYPAGAKLPNDGNAHVTMRQPMWCKGVFDAIAPEFPDITYVLYASTSFMECVFFAPGCMAKELSLPGYTRALS